MLSICKFCGKEKQLVQSHIIPKCLHATNQGRMVGINATTKFDMNPNAQNGYKERLLCADCDNKLGVFDNYARKFFYDIIPNASTDVSDGFNIYNIQSDKFDYEKLYKFFVSVLWRCGVSSKRVDLKKYQQIAFDILTDKAQIQSDLFLPIICKKEVDHPSNYATGMSPGRFAGKYAYCLKIPGYEITIVVNTKDSNDPKSIDMYKTYFCKNCIKVIKMGMLSTVDKLLSHKVALNKKMIPNLRH